MGSSSKNSNTVSNQNQTWNTNQTAGTNQSQSASIAPWAAAQPALTSLLGNITQASGNTGLTGAENTAIAGLTTNANAGNPYAPGIGGLANDLLTGGQDRTGYVTNAYNQLQGSLSPYTTMDTNPYSNPAFANYTNTLTNDITDRIKSQYAGAGYSPVTSGDYAQSLGRGISQGLAPTWLQASNDLENRKLGAISSLYSAGGQTAGLLSGLDQNALANRQAGVDVAGSALTAANQPYTATLAAEALRRGIPIENLTGLSNLIVPMAQLGRTVEGTTQGTTQTVGQGAGQSYGTQNTNQTSTPGLLDYLGLFGGGNNSPISGLARSGSSLLGILGL